MLASLTLPQREAMTVLVTKHNGDNTMSTHDSNYTPSGADLEDALNSAIATLLWTTPTPTASGDDSAGYLDGVGAPFNADSRRALYREIVEFTDANSADLHGLTYEQIGHDFILTRNRHGAGFWDRGLGERGDRLTDAAHAYGEIDAYLADDGTISAE